MLNDINTPNTALDDQDDVNTVTLIPSNDTNRHGSNKLEPCSPKRPSTPDLTLVATTTPTTTYDSFYITPHIGGKTHSARHHSRQVTTNPFPPATPNKLNIGPQLTPNNKDNIVYDAYCKKKRH